MINLDKINPQIDINNLNLAQITKLLIEYQKIVKIVLVIGSLLLVWGMFNDYRTKGQGLKAKLAQEQEKLEAIKARDGAIQDLSKFKSSLPKEISVYDLIMLIQNFEK